MPGKRGNVKDAFPRRDSPRRTLDDSSAIGMRRVNSTRKTRKGIRDDSLSDAAFRPGSSEVAGSMSGSMALKLPPPANKAALPHPDDLVVIPTDEEVMATEKLQSIVDRLTNSLVTLRTKTSIMEVRVAKAAAIVNPPSAPPPPSCGNRSRAASPLVSRPVTAAENAAPPLLPFQVRRAKQEMEQIEAEMAATARIVAKLTLMSQQLVSINEFKDTVFSLTKAELEAEIAALQATAEGNLDSIRDGYIGRINLLHRYWPWRQLLDLGDTSVGGTFEEELQRGPRFRHVGVQNSIESDYIETQLRWLGKFTVREDAFRGYLRRLDSLVEDLHDINDLLETTLTCGVCQLIFEEPVIFWPCGHTFCLPCFESLTIAPSLFRCPACGSIGSEGYVHNLLVTETVAKWMFKSSGYGDLQGPLNNIRVHLSRFRKDRTEARIAELSALLKRHKDMEASRGDKDRKNITVSYRTY